MVYYVLLSRVLALTPHTNYLGNTRQAEASAQDIADVASTASVRREGSSGKFPKRRAACGFGALSRPSASRRRQTLDPKTVTDVQKFSY